jgi:predicted kinase
MKTFNEFITEARTRPSQRASKGGIMPKYGQRSGKSELDHDVIMRGIPGSGKSTMAKRLAKATGGTSYGFDDARKEIHGHHSVQGPIKPVKDLTYKTLSAADRIKPRILDNTGTAKNFKKSTENELKDIGFRNPQEVSPDTKSRATFRRNRKRDHSVPQFVLRRMSQQNRENPGKKEAIKRGRDLTKRYRLNRKSTGAKLGLPRRRGSE